MENFKKIQNFLDENGIALTGYAFQVCRDIGIDTPNSAKMIKEILDRYQKTPNKYEEEIMTQLRQRRGLEKYDTSEDDDINAMTPNEVFSNLLNWNGLSGWDNTIHQWIEEIYGVSLSKISNKE